jgi:hypothetical protein
MGLPRCFVRSQSMISRSPGCSPAWPSTTSRIESASSTPARGRWGAVSLAQAAGCGLRAAARRQATGPGGAATGRHAGAPAPARLRRTCGRLALDGRGQAVRGDGAHRRLPLLQRQLGGVAHQPARVDEHKLLVAEEGPAGRAAGGGRGLWGLGAGGGWGLGADVAARRAGRPGGNGSGKAGAEGRLARAPVVQPVARHARLVVHHRHRAAHQPVEQGGLAHVGAAHDGDLRAAGAGGGGGGGGRGREVGGGGWEEAQGRPAGAAAAAAGRAVPVRRAPLGAIATPPQPPQPAPPQQAPQPAAAASSSPPWAGTRGGSAPCACCAGWPGSG